MDKSYVDRIKVYLKHPRINEYKRLKVMMNMIEHPENYKDSDGTAILRSLGSFKHASSPEYKEKQRQRFIQYNKDPEMRKLQKANIDYSKAKERIIRYNRDPEMRKIQAANSRDKKSVKMKLQRLKYPKKFNPAGSVSKPEKEIFEYLHFFYPKSMSQYQIKGHSHLFDIYIPELNLLIEFDGEYYHRNQDYDNDWREKLARDHGYEYLVIKESDWRKQGWLGFVKREVAKFDPELLNRSRFK